MAADNIYSKDQLIQLAKLAEKTERFDDMAHYMKEFAKFGTELTQEERHLLSVAYKNSLGIRRSALRIISKSKQNAVEDADSDKEDQALVKVYREKIQLEYHNICSEFLELLEKNLIPEAITTESSVSYMKWRADYNRYLALITDGDDKAIFIEKAKRGYQTSYELAKAAMGPAHPIRLGVALNYSVFYFDVLKSPGEACQLIKEVIEYAVPNLKEGDPTYEESQSTMQLLRENLDLWSSDDAAQKTGGKSMRVTKR